MFEPAAKPQKKGVQPLTLILAVAALFGATIFGYLHWLGQQPQIELEPVLTDEAKAYLPNLELSPDTAMAAREDALGQTLLEITGRITNNGDRTISLAEVNVVFREINGIEISRQRSTIVNARTGSLHQGETQEFRLPFDNVPAEWNQAFPSLFISQIEFE